MKKVISLLLSVVVIMSMFTMLSTTASAASPKDVMEVEKSAVVNGKITFDIYLKAKTSVTGAIVKVVYDSSVLTPVQPSGDNCAHKTAKNEMNGIFVCDKVAGQKNAYSLAYASFESYSTGKNRKGFMTVSFKVKGTKYPKTSVKFYCVEFNSPDTNEKIEKNDSNPPLLKSFTTATLNKLSYKSIARVSNGIKIQWNATPGAKGYKIYKYKNGKAQQIASTAKLYYTDKKAAINKVEKYIVRAFNDSGLDSGFSTRSGKFYLSVPTVKLTKLSNGVKVTWNAVARAKKYNVYRKYSGGSWKKLTQVSSSVRAYTDKKVTSGKTVYYTVRAVNGSALSDYVAKKIVYVAQPTVKSLKNKVSGVELKWNDVSGASGYRVYKKVNNDKHWKKVTDVVSSNYIDKNVNSGNKYTYTVRAIKGDNLSTYHRGKSYVFLKAPQISNITNTVFGVKVKWNEVNGADSYRVYRKTTSTSWSILGTSDSGSFTDKGAKNNVKYTYTVRAASGADGKGIFSGYRPGISFTK